MTAPVREALPLRRPLVTGRIDAGGMAAHASAGWVLDGAGRPVVRELFLRPASGGKTGSALDALADDLAVLLSLALQHGLALDALSRSLGRAGDGTPASLAGAALRFAAETEAHLATAGEAGP